jgi:hypothetical protein
MGKFNKLPWFLGLLVTSNLFVLGVAAQDDPNDKNSLHKSEAQVAKWFDKNRDNKSALTAFVRKMPKGGDIHSHLSGAVYAEDYLKWAAEDGYCVDPNAKILVEPSACGQNPSYIKASEVSKTPGLYDALIDKWSTRNLASAGQSGHDQFFKAFAGFSAISSSASRQDEMVASVTNRAASQNIYYLELMMTVRGSEVRQLGRTVGWNPNFAEMRQKLLDRKLMDLVKQGSQDLAETERQLPITLQCGTPSAQPGCKVTVRYLQQTTRTKAPEEVFAQLLYAFELANADPRVVGINLVAPEDDPVALRDYTLQMEMLKFLRGQYPETKIALHAGELTPEFAPPEALRSHIREAVEVAGAKRIGHGVDIMGEDKPAELMAQMKKLGVLVEICLTSNEVILNIENDEHPFMKYWKAGVPLTLASDDEGISRIDLSNEYILATQRYKLGYKDLKVLARNSLEYSFIEGKSLWESPELKKITSACAKDTPGLAATSSECSTFLKENDRARLQWELESNFAAFEKSPSYQ